MTGVQLSKLTKAGKDELALFVAQKKVVGEFCDDSVLVFWTDSTECSGPAFREQDLADLPIGDAVEYGRYFGRLHIHPTSGAPHGHPEVHLVHRGVDGRALRTHSSHVVG